MLTIRNHWEHASIPIFPPMAEEIVVALDQLEEAFELQFAPQGQEQEMSVAIRFQPIA